MFNWSNASTGKIHQQGISKVTILKRFTKETMRNSFCRAPCK